jgi:hypothetical protein
MIIENEVLERVASNSLSKSPELLKHFKVCCLIKCRASLCLLFQNVLLETMALTVNHEKTMTRTEQRCLDKSIVSDILDVLYRVAQVIELPWEGV